MYVHVCSMYVVTMLQVSVKNVVNMCIYCNYVSLFMRVAIFRAKDTSTYMQYCQHTDKIHAYHSDKIHATFNCTYVECMCMYVVCMCALCVRSVVHNTSVMAMYHYVSVFFNVCSMCMKHGVQHHGNDYLSAFLCICFL
jgi:hypothetical protein